MVHHSSDQADYDKNFGGVFIFWDKIFGTFQEYHGSVEIGAVDENYPIDKKSFLQKLLLVFHPLPLIFRGGQRLPK